MGDKCIYEPDQTYSRSDIIVTVTTAAAIPEGSLVGPDGVVTSAATGVGTGILVKDIYAPANVGVTATIIPLERAQGVILNSSLLPAGTLALQSALELLGVKFDN